MSEKPILFSAPMVRALLEGRKTQTRRVVKPQPPPDAIGLVPCDDGVMWMDHCVAGEPSNLSLRNEFKCPYPPGTRLWVRETWAYHPDPCGDPPSIIYRADEVWDGMFDAIKWKSPYHIFRKDSRLTLLVKSVRVERVQDIGKDGRKAHDVLAEGITKEQIAHHQKFFHPDDSPALAFGQLWDSINGKAYSWASNPWVWVISFTRAEQEKGAE
jgi:hypothetical protein